MVGFLAPARVVRKAEADGIGLLSCSLTLSSKLLCIGVLTHWLTWQIIGPVGHTGAPSPLVASVESSREVRAVPRKGLRSRSVS